VTTRAFRNQAGKILKAAGLRRTPGRTEIIELLLQAEQPLTQEEITTKLSTDSLDKVTVYRALDAFLSVGIVHRIETGNRVWRYAVCSCGSRKHCHPHFICKSCGRVECLTGVKMPIVTEIKPGYQVEEQETYVKGLCVECSNQNSLALKGRFNG